MRTARGARKVIGAVVLLVVLVMRCQTHIPACVSRMGRIWGRAVVVLRVCGCIIGVSMYTRKKEIMNSGFVKLFKQRYNRLGSHR